MNTARAIARAEQRRTERSEAIHGIGKEICDVEAEGSDGIDQRLERGSSGCREENDEGKSEKRNRGKIQD
jgi:hypothetical protein